MTEDEYRRFIADQRAQGREHVRRLCWDLRRRLFGRYPDPIDRENIAKVTARFGDLNTAMRQAAFALEPIRITMDSFNEEAYRWRAEQRIALSVLPDLSPLAVIASPA